MMASTTGDDNKVKERELLLKRERVASEVKELLLERERVASVVKEHYEQHPPHTEDCPICFEPTKTFEDTKVQHLACCGHFLCAECANSNYEHGYMKSCPLCRAPPPKTDAAKMKLTRERAADGRAWAQYNLGLYYSDGSHGDYKEAMKWFKLAAEQNFPDAVHELAEIHSRGVVGTVYKWRLANHAKSFRYYKQAADLGCATSQTNVGELYKNGYGTHCDESKAVYYCTLAYSQTQHPNAGYNLGCFFLEGIGGLDKSLVRAKYYLKGAAEGGNISAYHLLDTIN